MRYIARFVDGESMRTFGSLFDGEILVEFVLLKMLVLELTDENSVYSKDDLEDFPGVIYIKEDLVVALDDKTPVNEKKVTKQTSRCVRRPLYLVLLMAILNISLI